LITALLRIWKTAREIILMKAYRCPKWFKRNR